MTTGAPSGAAPNNKKNGRTAARRDVPSTLPTASDVARMKALADRGAHAIRADLLHPDRAALRAADARQPRQPDGRPRGRTRAEASTSRRP